MARTSDITGMSEHMEVSKQMEREVWREKKWKKREDRETILRAPFGDKSQAMATDKRRRKREQEVRRRRGKQVTPAEFTRHMESVHRQG